VPTHPPVDVEDAWQQFSAVGHGVSHCGRHCVGRGGVAGVSQVGMAQRSANRLTPGDKVRTRVPCQARGQRQRQLRMHR
jgi:hypothetical protein